MKKDDHIITAGVIATRTCPLCGHQEVGLTTDVGQFYPLTPGTRIQLVEEPPDIEALAEEKGPTIMEDDEEPATGSVLWIPEALRDERPLRLKYGVMLKRPPEGGKMSGNQYRTAYLAKLQRLVEEESDTPIPVLLDRFFAAPHLAAGNPRQITEALWRELDEVTRPVFLMSEWLEKQDEESLSAMIHPFQKDGPRGAPISDEDIIRELEALTLEEFLEWL